MCGTHNTPGGHREIFQEGGVFDGLESELIGRLRVVNVICPLVHTNNIRVDFTAGKHCSTVPESSHP